MRQAEHRTGRAVGLVALVGTMLVGAAVAATGAGTLDQQQTTSSDLAFISFGDIQSGAQTFTAGITGSLDQADLLLERLGNPSPTVTVEIRTTSAGQPTDTVLATTTVSSASVPYFPGTSFTSVMFAQPASVTAGTQYALVAYSPGGFQDLVRWRTAVGDPYAGGQAFVNDGPPPPGSSWTDANSDAAFKTYVTAPAVPAPTTCAGLDATIVGTAGDDVLVGTSNGDVIAGLGGDDIIKSDGGNDIICGGYGDDKLKGGSGNDRLYGERGADRLKGGTGTDLCLGGRGDDTTSSCERP